MFLCRWPNGDVSFVSAEDEEDAVIQLDEWDNAELAELTPMPNFLVDFQLTAEGELELHAFGERTADDIQERAYPLLSEAKLKADKDGEGELTFDGEEMIRLAVELEKTRLSGKKTGKVADTELGKSLQDHLGAPAVLINRKVQQAAAEVLKKTPVSGRKQ